MAEAVPALAALKGVGIDRATSLLIAAGDNPKRLKSEAAFTTCLGGARSGSLGKTRRHRLNREANRALDVIALGRVSWDERS